MENRSLLDPVIVAQLGNLQIRARHILDGMYSGHHTSQLHGGSQEFSEHRPYYPGDDLKSLDWKALGRTDRLVIKQFEEETNISGVAIIDDSASMNFSYDGRPSKLEYAKTLAAALGYLMNSQSDAIGLLTKKQFIAPGSQRGHLEQFFNRLEKIQGDGTWALDKLIQSPPWPLKKRSFFFIFSDLMANSVETVAALRALQSRKSEVLVFHLLDPAEQNLPFDGPILFEDSESHETLRTEPETIRRAYQKFVEQQIQAFTHAFRSSGIDYHFLLTSTPFDKGMGAFLSWRAAHI